MTALTVIIFILQLVLTAWAIGITIVVVDLFKAFRSTSAVDGEAFASLFDAQNTTFHALHAVLKTVGAVDEEAKGYKAMVDAELEKHKDNNRFALETIQEARRIYRQASEIAGMTQLHIDSDAFMQQLKEKIKEDSNDDK